jgi:hypothetical protein
MKLIITENDNCPALYEGETLTDCLHQVLEGFCKEIWADDSLPEFLEIAAELATKLRESDELPVKVSGLSGMVDSLEMVLE